jgi:hypothetical protein
MVRRVTEALVVTLHDVIWPDGDEEKEEGADVGKSPSLILKIHEERFEEPINSRIYYLFSTSLFVVEVAA